jgi:hypothetical protein
MLVALWVFDTLIDTLRGVFPCFLLDFHGLYRMKSACGVGSRERELACWGKKLQTFSVICDTISIKLIESLPRTRAVLSGSTGKQSTDDEHK